MTRVIVQRRARRAVALATVAACLMLLVVVAALIADAVGDSFAVPVVAPEPVHTTLAPASTVTSTTSTTVTVAVSAPVSVTSAPIDSAPPAPAGGVHAAGARSWTWDQLADCESGDWDADRHPIAGTARWDDNRGGYEGGVHFAPSTWDWYRPAGYPDAAYVATRAHQIAVAELVLDDQGPRAWPRCSYMVGMR